jgi:hypothetical protein
MSSNQRRRNKQKAVEYLGNKCCNCGNSFPQAVYDFHHVDPSIKESKLRDLMSKSWEIIKAELDKCILLCANCHRVEHMKDCEEKENYLV